MLSLIPKDGSIIYSTIILSFFLSSFLSYFQLFPSEVFFKPRHFKSSLNSNLLFSSIQPTVNPLRTLNCWKTSQRRDIILHLHLISIIYYHYPLPIVHYIRSPNSNGFQVAFSLLLIFFYLLLNKHLRTPLLPPELPHSLAQTQLNSTLLYSTQTININSVPSFLFPSSTSTISP